MKKTHDWEDIIANQIERDKHHKGKKEKIDYDLVAYGVSLQRETLENIEKKQKKNRKK